MQTNNVRTIRDMIPLPLIIVLAGLIIANTSPVAGAPNCTYRDWLAYMGTS